MSRRLYSPVQVDEELLQCPSCQPHRLHELRGGEQLLARRGGGAEHVVQAAQHQLHDGFQSVPLLPSIAQHSTSSIEE